MLKHERLVVLQELGVELLRRRVRQVDADALRQQRRRDHEDDQQHEHHVDVRHDVDLGHQPPLALGDVSCLELRKLAGDGAGTAAGGFAPAGVALEDRRQLLHERVVAHLEPRRP